MFGVMSRTILIIVHSHEPSLGRVGRYLLGNGDRIDLRAPVFGAPLPDDLSGYDACFVFGGPQSANDDGDPGIAAELKFIPRWIETDRPFVGICLGAQLLTRSLGGEVALHPEGKVEIGYYPIHGTAQGADLFPNGTHLYHWHKESMSLPDGAIQLARNDTYENQAYRIGERIWAVQFHPEMTRAIMERWMNGAADKMEAPNAQKPDQQRAGCKLHSEAAGEWTVRFLDHVFTRAP
ncbi:MAG: GMP synthase [Alphaproteobacteria bacterium]|nr:GMP synthase [Alphaproteobacteria bacterium]